jgi:glycerophosphoryl diester phosphodiesterase
VSSPPLIIAHRGASARAPENTLAAFRRAIADGSDGVEFDVRLAADGVPVVFHDRTLLRTAGLKGELAGLTSSRLARIDVGSWFNSARPELAETKFASERIPSLKRVLALFSGHRGRLYIELKCSTDDAAALTQAVCAELVEHSPGPEILVKSFHLSVIPMIRMLAPRVRTAALFAPRIRSLIRKRRHIIGIARELGADELSLHCSLATGRLVRLAGEAKLAVTIWTTDDPRWVVRARERGVRAIITNDPAKLIAARELAAR